MITTVNFEISKLLKEKGFDEYCKLCVEECDERPLPFNAGNTLHKNSLHPYYSAPTIAEVITWLYEKHGIFVTVTIPYNEFGKFSAEIWGKESDNIKILLVDGMSVFSTINQAYEEGIIESLKLI